MINKNKQETNKPQVVVYMEEISANIKKELETSSNKNYDMFCQLSKMNALNPNRNRHIKKAMLQVKAHNKIVDDNLHTIAEMNYVLRDMGIEANVMSVDELLKYKRDIDLTKASLEAACSHISQDTIRNAIVAGSAVCAAVIGAITYLPAIF